MLQKNMFAAKGGTLKWVARSLRFSSFLNSSNYNRACFLIFFSRNTGKNKETIRKGS